MNKSKVELGYSTHALERGLERIMGLEPPYSSKQRTTIREFLDKSIVWNPFNNKWVLEDYGAELVIKDGSVVTLIIKEVYEHEHKPISEYQKTMSKKAKRLNKTRNSKSKYKQGDRDVE